MSAPPPVEPVLDRTPHPFGDGPVDPIVHDASVAALRQRTVNFAAKRYADMMFVSGLDRATADRHFRLRAAPVPAGLDARLDGPGLQAAFAAGHVVVETEPAERRATARWNEFFTNAPVVGNAVARPGYGGILLGPHAAAQFDPKPIARSLPDAGRPWPRGDAVDAPAPAPPAVAQALGSVGK